MIPVRVPADAPMYLVGGERSLQPDHPLYDALCPACDEPLAALPITLVYVGMRPDDRKDSGWATGASVPVHVSCVGPGAQSETTPWVHRYISTACEHALHENRPELHAECRLSCKYSPDGVESCTCPHHTGMPLGEMPPPWVDQARGIALELLTLIEEDDHFRLPAELAERVRSDPNLFWLRREVQPPGQWRPHAPESDAGGPDDNA